MEKRNVRLSEADQILIEKYERKMAVVADLTAGVANGLQTGAYFYGIGGSGKSFTVKRKLEQCGVSHQFLNSHLTAKGLYDALEAQPDIIWVLEDMEQVINNKATMGVLRSALWGPIHRGRRIRRVTWTKSGERMEFEFTGGIIIIANRPLRDVPELQALASRITPIRIDPTQAEIKAMMRKICLDGYSIEGHELSPDECWHVGDFIIDESDLRKRPLDLRLAENGFEDFLNWRLGNTQNHWKDLVRTRIRERPTTDEPVSREECKRREQEIAAEIASLPRDERLAVWRERTGKSEPALYRRLREVQPNGAA